jgi:phage gp45-like
MMAELVKIASAVSKVLHGAPGQAVVITGAGAGGQAVEAEVFAPAGILSRPPKDARGVFIPLGGSRKYGVVLSGHNYKVAISLADGETAIFSTTANGTTLKAQILLRADGTIEINGTAKRLITDDLAGLLATFITALNAQFATKLDGGGAPATLSLDITSAKTTTLKTGG